MANNLDDKDIVPEIDADISSDTDSDNVDDSVVAEESAKEIIKTLKEKLKKAETEKLEYLTGWQRAKADLINARKRDEADRTEFMKYANEGLVGDLIPVLESFDMAIGNKESWEKVDKNWRVGVEYIYNQLKKVLGENGWKEVNPIGEKFDHNRDEAIEHVAVDDKKQDQVVIQVLQKGYSLNGKLLKAPRVKVGEFRS
jgi:molecular chaperone GrpE